MKICWDTLKNIRLTKYGNFKKIDKSGNFYGRVLYIGICKNCNEEFLGNKRSLFCDSSCSKKGEFNPFYNKKHTEESKKLISKNNAIISGEGHPMFGKKHTEESKKKMSAALKKQYENGERTILKGKNHPHYGKTGEDSIRYNKKHTEEAKKKMSVAKKGKYVGEKHPKYKKPVPNDVREKISKSLMGRFIGEDSPHWKGGWCKGDYCNIFQTVEFKTSIKNRDNHICLNPGCINKIIPSINPLVIHHIDYDKKNCGFNNLICICNSCNARANANREWYTEWYRRILSKRYRYVYN